ncbi:MAG: YHS domain-containing protein [Alphaproteobacteria bacterium]
MSHFWGSIESLLYFLLLAGAFFLMMRFGCGAHVHRHGSGHEGGATGRPPPETATDPVCGMTVETRDAKTSVLDGVTHYFCSSECRETFEASPGTYLKTKPASRHPQHEEHSHG